MNIALVGGMDRLERHYVSEAERFGVDIKIFNKLEADMASKIRNVSAVVIFTNKVSHKAKREAISIAKSMNIPILMRHSCGVCTLRDCLYCLKVIARREIRNGIRD